MERKKCVRKTDLEICTMAQINVLFPTPLYTEQLEVRQDEVDFIDGLEYNDDGRITKNTYILNLPELKTLKEEIDSHVKNFFFEIYKPKTEVDIYITQSWGSKCKVGVGHHKHSHANSIFSGVYYPCADAEVDEIGFARNRHVPWKVYSDEYTIWNSETWSFPVGTGTLIIFPSHLYHYVNHVSPSVNRDVRMSLAFNTFLKGRIGDYEGLVELDL